MDNQGENLSPYEQQQVNNFWNRFRYYAAQAWPYIMQLLSFLVYTTVTIIRSAVKIAVEQLKMGG